MNRFLYLLILFSIYIFINPRPIYAQIVPTELEYQTLQQSSQDYVQAVVPTVPLDGGYSDDTLYDMPRVVRTDGSSVQNIQQLPKTGFPLAGFLLASLLPAGLILRKFGENSPKELSSDAPYYLHQLRQVKKLI